MGGLSRRLSLDDSETMTGTSTKLTAAVESYFADLGAGARLGWRDG